MAKPRSSQRQPSCCEVPTGSVVLRYGPKGAARNVLDSDRLVMPSNVFHVRTFY